jgi:hypothetical protein
MPIEISKVPHFLDNRIAAGDEESLMRLPPFNPPPPTRKIPSTHFYYRLTME